MGEVYRARDSKLERDVAIKVLRADVAGDRDRLARFGREARILAALNHPNIANVIGLEDATDTPALVMELVDGPTLALRIEAGALPLDEALDIAGQIAEALEAAHERGVIHRDLKPANVKIRPDGLVKVLDFGLAKALDPTGPAGLADPAHSPTITSPMMTMRGVILGTAAYMSPEQAKGRPVDRRADLWACGCVLYEMLTGRRAFEGEDTTETIAAVVTKEPDWTALPPSTPASIRRLLQRLLVKNPKQRLDSAAVVRLELADAAAALKGGATEGDAPRRRRSAAAQAAAADRGCRPAGRDRRVAGDVGGDAEARDTGSGPGDALRIDASGVPATGAELQRAGRRAVARRDASRLHRGSAVAADGAGAR